MKFKMKKYYLGCDPEHYYPFEIEFIDAPSWAVARKEARKIHINNVKANNQKYEYIIELDLMEEVMELSNRLKDLGTNLVQTPKVLRHTRRELGDINKRISVILKEIKQ